MQHVSLTVRSILQSRDSDDGGEPDQIYPDCNIHAVYPLLRTLTLSIPTIVPLKQQAAGQRV